jgi:hypothetical protein
MPLSALQVTRPMLSLSLKSAINSGLASLRRPDPRWAPVKGDGAKLDTLPFGLCHCPASRPLGRYYYQMVQIPMQTKEQRAWRINQPYKRGTPSHVARFGQPPSFLPCSLHRHFPSIEVMFARRTRVISGGLGPATHPLRVYRVLTGNTFVTGRLVPVCWTLDRPGEWPRCRAKVRQPRAGVRIIVGLAQAFWPAVWDDCEHM